MVEGLRIEGEKGAGRAALRNSDAARVDTRPDSVREAEAYALEAESARDLGEHSYDKFHIPPEIIPEGWSYQWKAAAVAGKENVYHILALRKAKWREVMAERHPWMMPTGYEGPITVDGLVLMELPKVLTDKAEYAHIRESKEVLRASEQKLYETPANTGPRDDPGLTSRGLHRVTRSRAESNVSRED